VSTSAAEGGEGDRPAGKVGVVGRTDVLAPFRAAGFVVFPVEPGPEADARVEELIGTGLSVLFYTEDLSPYLAGLVSRRSRAATPCMVMLSMGAEQRGFARLREVVKRAVGADVFGRGQARGRPSRTDASSTASAGGQ
jgi:vacuolar-type H+-ATPase subunit F/Vma7